MSLRFIDGFDHYVTADISEKWSSAVNTPAVNASAGRRGGGALLAPNSGTLGQVYKVLDAQGTWVIGAALKLSPITANARDIIALYDSGTIQAAVRLNADGTLSAMRGTTVIGTTTFALSAGLFYYIEMKVVIHDSTGTFEIKVDGSSKLALTSQDTKNTSNATANEIRIGPAGTVSAGSTYTWDDLYICDGQGSTNNTFLGDCRVDTVYPTGNGNSSQLTGSDGNSTDNYLLVDETSPNDDTDYVESSTAGNKDTYACGDISHTPTSIFGIQVLANAKKDDAGARSIATVTRSGSTDYDGATQALSTSYVYYSDIRETDPNTAAAWTKTNLNAAEHGVKVAA